jgi:hypothetical protein
MDTLEKKLKIRWEELLEAEREGVEIDVVALWSEYLVECGVVGVVGDKTYHKDCLVSWVNNNQDKKIKIIVGPDSTSNFSHYLIFPQKE